MKNFIVDYTGLLRAPAKARARLYAGPQGRAVWLIQSEGPGLEKYQGLSVTNGIERIIARLLMMQERDFAFIVEHYPGKRHDDPTKTGGRIDGHESFFDVRFALWRRRRIGITEAILPYKPVWRAMSRADVEELIGEPIGE